MPLNFQQGIATYVAVCDDQRAEQAYNADGRASSARINDERQLQDQYNHVKQLLETADTITLKCQDTTHVVRLLSKRQAWHAHNLSETQQSGPGWLAAGKALTCVCWRQTGLQSRGLCLGVPSLAA